MMQMLPKKICKMMCIPIAKDCKRSGDDIKWEDTTEFIFPVHGGRVIKVYDGDTITIASKMPFKTMTGPIYRFSIRLNGINTPEMKGKNISDDEKNAAIQVQHFVSNLLLNKYVSLKNVKNEKYGRILADVYIENIHVNELLLKERYAVPYDGTTKKSPKSWLKYKITGEII
jgi:endonuclease YncB( thermonuclease family)